MNNKFVWHNPYLPQTLLIAEAILYFSSILDLVFNAGNITLMFLAIQILQFLAAFGIANLRWWGIIFGVFSVGFQFAYPTFLALQDGFSIFEVLKAFFSSQQLIGTIFNIAIIALLVHPMSIQFAKSRFTKQIP
jgi:hypothetical protein